MRSHQTNVNNNSPGHEHQQIRRTHTEIDRENELAYRARPRPRTHHYGIEQPMESDTTTRPRPRSFYENPVVGREFRDQRNSIDPRDVREILSNNRFHFNPIRIKIMIDVSDDVPIDLEICDTIQIILSFQKGCPGIRKIEEIIK